MKTLADRIRVIRAVLAYDFWLESYGVKGGDRRDLRREFRANIDAARADHQVADAISRTGGPRALARSTATEIAYPGRPRWLAGCYAALFVFLFLFLLFMWGSSAFYAGVEAAGVTEPIRATPLLAPGVEYFAHFPADGSESVGMFISTWWVMAPVGSFLLASRIWRLWRPR